MIKPKTDLIGKQFGKLTVLYQTDDFVESNNKHRTMWYCRCECGKEVSVKDKSLKNGDVKSCGCLRKNKKVIDLTNQRFGRLLVLEKVEKIKTPSGQYRQLWKCLCDCGTICNISGVALKNGNTKSCGCLRKETIAFQSKKYNLYDLTGEYGIGYTSKGEEFYFDLEDYDLIKDYCWYKRPNGYIISDTKEKSTHMHRLVMGLKKDSEYEIDHKKANSRNDNRKNNLRIATHSENMRNVGVRKHNTSGITGVDWVEKLSKWRVRIFTNQTENLLGYFENFEDAVKVRKEAEDRVFEKWSYDNSNNLEK